MKILILIAITALCGLAPLTGHARLVTAQEPAAGEAVELQRPRVLFKCRYCGRVAREPFQGRCPDRIKGRPHVWLKFRP